MTTTGNGSTHPFLDFCHDIANDPNKLNDFVKNPAAVALTDSQRKALLSGDWKAIEAEVRKENPTLIKVTLPDGTEDLRLPVGNQGWGPTNAGWVLSTLPGKLLAAEKGNPVPGGGQ